MGINFGKLFGGEDRPSGRTFAVNDSLLTTPRVLKHIIVESPALYQEWDDIEAKAKAAAQDFFGYVLRTSTRLSTGAAAMLLAALVNQWLKGMVDDPNMAVFALEAVWDKSISPGTTKDRLFENLISAVQFLSEISLDPKRADDRANEAGKSYLELSHRLEWLGHLDAALGCAQSAANLLGTLDGAHALPAATAALRITRKEKIPDHIAGELARMAHMRAQIAAGNPLRRLEAFDAMETALRYFLLIGKIPAFGVPIVKAWLTQSAYLIPLQTLTRSLLPGVKFQPTPPELQTAEERFIPIWKGDTEEWIEGVLELLTWARMLEDRRLNLRPQQARSIQFRNSSMTVEHFALQAATPFGEEAILRHPDADNLLLELAHEVTHVYSLSGVVGAALMALRWIIFEWEAAHVTRPWIDGVNMRGVVSADDRKELDYHFQRFLEDAEPARLQEPNSAEMILAYQVLPSELVWAEQQLEGIRKYQILERIWSPWMEGLAVFAESSVEPGDDADAYTPVASVVSNLSDHSFGEKKSKAEIVEEYHRYWAAGEKRFAEARKRQSVFRLYSYFLEYPKKYLAGYLAVRCIVAEWRNKNGRALSGAEAFAILLHVTRFSSFQCLPDPELPLEQFTEQATARHLEWVRSLAQIPQDALHQIKDSFQDSRKKELVAWRDGRLERGIDPGNAATEMIQNWMRYAQRFMTTLCHPHAAIDRAPGANPFCKETMRIAAEALAKRENRPVFFREDTLNTLLAGRFLIPIAHCESPFWLLTKDRRLACIIRTRDNISFDVPGGPAIILPLSEEEFASLEEKVRNGGPSRIRITRAAYLETLGGLGIGQGSNFLIFQYDGWIKIKSAGFLMDASDDFPIDEVKNSAEARFNPPEVMRAQERLVNEEHPCARRSLEWLEKQDWKFPIPGGEADLTPWSNRAVRLAKDILEQPEDADTAAINQALIEFVFGVSNTSANLANSYLAPLKTSQSLIDQLLAGLEGTGPMPQSTSTIDFATINQQTEPTIGQWFEKNLFGWDVLRPASCREKENKT